jgi:hypothetical protein
MNLLNNNSLKVEKLINISFELHRCFDYYITES